ncbi:MAG: hypothetical protein KF830_00535 [Planctomycetes bacterium]|nr:hypothetical protein [Planctomycetota bacterium]
MTRTRSPRRRPPTAAARLLPESLLDLPLAQLELSAEVAASLQEHGLRRIADLLDLPAGAFGRRGWFHAAAVGEVQRALGHRLRRGLAQATAAAADVGHDGLRDELLAGLDPDQRQLVCELTGLGAAPLSRLAAARRRSLAVPELEDRAEQARARLHQTAPALLGRLRYEVGRDLASGDGVLPATRLVQGSLLQVLAAGSGDARLGPRLVAFCFPREFTLHGDCLCALPARYLRRLVRALPELLPPQRLPLPVAALQAELQGANLPLPRGLLLHLLRTELRLEVENAADGRETIVADPRSPSARLVDLLLDLARPTPLDELVYAYRERFRRASRRRIEQRLRQNPAFVQLGPSLWSLRRWHLDELANVAPLVDRVARQVAAGDRRQRVADLLDGDRTDDQVLYLVLDRLAADPRVRLLGRGEVCAATHRESRVLSQLLADFRRAAGDVVESLFVHNQPPERRRLVGRLLRHNRAFVSPAADRIDVLTNYPFNRERMRRLVNLVGHQLDQRAGRAAIADLKSVLDGTDLGGAWLSPTLLADLLRRHGPFDLLGHDIVCRRELQLPASLLRTVRQALRAAGVPLTVDEILAARPELSEFAACLHDLVSSDPLLQSPDGQRFLLP